MSPLVLIRIKAPILCHHHWCDEYIYDCQGDNKHSGNCPYTSWSLIIPLEILQLGFLFELLVKILLFVCLDKVFLFHSDFFWAMKIKQALRCKLIRVFNFLCVWEFAETEIITSSRKTPTLVQNRELSHKGWTWCATCLWTCCSGILGSTGSPLIIKCGRALRSLLQSFLEFLFCVWAKETISQLIMLIIA